MDFAELKNKTVAELKEILAEERAKLRDFRFKAKAGALKQVHLVPIARKTVAHIVMLLKNKMNA
jgi:ribosomal protein L29